MNLNRLLADFERKIPRRDLRHEPVSQASVGWHLDHSLRVIIAVIDALAAPSPEPYRWRFNGVRLYVLLLGHIPRGSARTPEAVLPTNDLTEASLQQRLDHARQKLALLRDIPAEAHWPHPYLGALNARMTRRFLYVHTRHHQKIVRDILAGWRERGRG